MIGYKVMKMEDGKLISGRNSSLNFEPKVNANMYMPGNGIYMTPDKDYALDYYSGLADNEVLLTLEFNPNEIITGDLSDKEPEISVNNAVIRDVTILESISGNSKFTIGNLPRDMKEEMFNLHAMFVNPESTEKSFYSKRVPIKQISINDIDVSNLKDVDTSRYTNISDLPPVVIADGKLIDGMHRVSEAQKQGVKSISAIDLSGYISPTESGYIASLNESDSCINNKFITFLESMRHESNNELLNVITYAYSLIENIDFKLSSKFISVMESTDDKYEIIHISGKSKVKTNIPPNKRSLNNIPRDSKGKAKVKFQDWLEMTNLKHGTGKGSDGKWYGWSHRAVYGFGVGDKVKKGDIIYKNKEYTIKDDAQAKESAQRFSSEVS